jgi:hypothetical protein
VGGIEWGRDCTMRVGGRDWRGSEGDSSRWEKEKNEI